MKKLLLGATFISLVLMSCADGITYSSCVVTTTDELANTFYPNGICRDVDGGGFLLKSDAVSWCQEKVPPESLAFIGITADELVYEPQRASCEAQED